MDRFEAVVVEAKCLNWPLQLSQFVVYCFPFCFHECKPLSYTIYLEIGLSTSRCPRKHGGCDVTGVKPLSYTIYLEIGLSTSRCPRKHGGCDVTGVKLGYSVHAVNH